MYEAIVVGTDGSETAKRAVDEAMRLAEAMGGRLHIVAAYEPLRGAKIVGAPEGAAKVWEVKPDAKVQSVIQEAEAGARIKGVEVETHTLTGDPAEALLEIAERQDADLIVVGNRGMHGVGRVLGSVPNKVSHRAPCNVLIVATDDA
jgi:nucleotide-binding universal stress UspA family protein